MISVRYWSVRNARFLEWFYQRFESALVSLHPVFKFIGYDRLEQPMAALEKWVKGLMFDCQMCGQCVLSSTGMSCPMNCPKTLRNGPCGGVRPDGNCEVKPDMRCVWVEGIEGSSRMRNGQSIHVIQIAVDHSLQGRSSWLRVAKQHFGAAG
jgi:hypothetical protein